MTKHSIEKITTTYINQIFTRFLTNTNNLITNIKEKTNYTIFKIKTDRLSLA